MAAADIYFNLLSRIVPPSPLVRSRRANLLLHAFAMRHLGRPRLGLFAPDDLLGWTHRPGVTTTHPAFEFRATYSIDDCARRMSGYLGAQPQVVLLGCSWAFGHGVNDQETVAWLLTADHAVPTYNYACMGYGPAHGYLQLNRRIHLDALAGSDCQVVYAWVPDQLMRAWRRGDWIVLNSWVNPHAPSHPVFDLVNGQLTHAGLAGVADAVTDPLLMPDLVERMEWAVTETLFEAMRDVVAATGRSFAVVIPVLPASDRDQHMARQMADRLLARNVDCIDLNSCLQYGRPADDELFYRFDGHPRPAWHHLTAAALARRLKTPALGTPTRIKDPS